MKRRFGVLLAVFVMCLMLATPVYAANRKPSVELMCVDLKKDSANGYSPTLYFCNNSGKTVKYYDWYFTLYNRVGDPTPNDITHTSSVVLQVVGPSDSDVAISSDAKWYNFDSTDYSGHPFYGFTMYGDTGRYIYHNGRLCHLYLDKYNNYFIFDGYKWSGGSLKYDPDTCTFLTPNEVENRAFWKSAEFNKAWYSDVFSYIRLQKVVVTYMDGTVETIDGAEAEASRINDSLSNGYFNADLNEYKDVYSPYDYVAYNPDLKDIFGDNKYGLFHHFLTSGMQEGRQGSKSFNLAAYKANNPDLVAAFGDNNAKYYEHYIMTGKAEGRKAT